MSSPVNPRLVAAALDFLSDLQTFATDCAATGLWDDELTVRRRQREEIRSSDGPSPVAEETQVKAL